jgi:hypothetical protein
MATPKKSTPVTLDMQIGDAVFMKIAKMAHANNMTFNEQINKIVQDAIANFDKPQQTQQTAFGAAAKPQG